MLSTQIEQTIITASSNVTTSCMDVKPEIQEKGEKGLDFITSGGNSLQKDEVFVVIDQEEDKEMKKKEDSEEPISQLEDALKKKNQECDEPVGKGSSTELYDSFVAEEKKENQENISSKEEEVCQVQFLPPSMSQYGNVEVKMNSETSSSRICVEGKQDEIFQVQDVITGDEHIIPVVETATQDHFVETKSVSPSRILADRNIWDHKKTMTGSGDTNWWGECSSSSKGMAGETGGTGTVNGNGCARKEMISSIALDTKRAGMCSEGFIMGKFNNLPEEIMLEILSRLPTESVLDCKLVCKPWKDVVRHPSFSQIHLNCLHSADDSGKFSFIFRSHQPGLHEFYYTEYDENCHETPRKTRINNLSFPYTLIDSCNGLVCFNSWREDNKSGPIGIGNPITREYVILPKSEGEYRWVGFGYTPSTNEYKVVRIYLSVGDSNVGIVQVYTLGSGTGWRNVGTMDIDTSHLRLELFIGAFVNGTLYWAIRTTTTFILAFHLADEKFSQLPPPPSCLTRAGVSHWGIHLGVLGDSLRATLYYAAGDCDIWLLKKNEDNSDLCWSKGFSMDSQVLQPFGYMKSGRVLCYGHKTIYSHDPRASSIKRDLSLGKSVVQAIPHKNTFISLKELGEKDTKTIEYGEKETENGDELKKPLHKIRDQFKKFIVAVQKLRLPECLS